MSSALVRESAASVKKPLLAVLHGERQDVPPVWLMRQAGRYLPEYRALRAEKGGFLALVYDSTAAADITLQPLDRFGTGPGGLGAAILFSDILIVPYAMGQDLWFEAGEGPRLAPTLDSHNLAALQPDWGRYEAIYSTIRQVAARLPQNATFLGFAGSPWTIATYMVAGQGSKDQGPARRMAYGEPERFGALIDAIVDATVTYLSGQIEAGVEAVQLFDSWAGSLAPLEFDRWVIAPNAQIVQRLKALHPHTPIIGFPKGAGAKLLDYAVKTGVDAVGLDETVDPHWANAVLPKGLPVQGNLDPLALITGGDAMARSVDNILAAFVDRPHIFNLGHGILPDAPIAHVEQLLARIGQ
ncbi:uroporphyrinogen decarboxylase [Sphingobium subterraneum]|uniref:Uroporphyrinogen decarboxylase n=1 Tax=Sphingobium subterraneum TaxID=627688 RepID=A0A841J077_9SPHN|nr:uroporphyrinogen decarboxylase [Sphingobium subterraneum]MBB6124084.1 uroporphyrinogen decarboxylase [Sphingobium subterraneum]